MFLSNFVQLSFMCFSCDFYRSIQCDHVISWNNTYLYHRIR